VCVCVCVCVYVCVWEGKRERTVSMKPDGEPPSVVEFRLSPGLWEGVC